MKHSVKVTSLVAALSVTTRVAPQMLAQRPPAARPTEQQAPAQQQKPAQQQTQTKNQQNTNQQNTPDKAKGTAAGSAVGAVAGNPSAGADTGNSHSRR
jgi:hypothetical protein